MATIWTAPEGHVILSAKESSHRVSSDHAWCDSDTGFAVVTWDGKRKHHHYINTGWAGDHPAIPVANATETDHRLAEVATAVSRFVSEVLSTAANAHFINHGTKVEVFKGRKCPHGRYEVTKHANGTYGPYVNLRATDGKQYSFISVDNIRVVPNYAAAFAAPQWTGFVKPFILTALAGNLKNGFGVLADAIQDRGGNFNGADATNFAEALRVTITDTEPKISTYYADCANEFRRPFAGI